MAAMYAHFKQVAPPGKPLIHVGVPRMLLNPDATEPHATEPGGRLLVQ